MSRLHILILAAVSVLLLTGVYACDEGTETSTESGQLTDEESRYLVTANRILADANAAFRPIRSLLSGSETVSDSAVTSSAEQLHELNEAAADLEPPLRFDEAHSLLIAALARMGQMGELAVTSVEAGNKDSLQAARTQAEEAFDLLKEASAAFLSAARR